MMLIDIHTLLSDRVWDSKCQGYQNLFNVYMCKTYNRQFSMVNFRFHFIICLVFNILTYRQYDQHNNQRHSYTFRQLHFRISLPELRYSTIFDMIDFMISKHNIANCLTLTCICQITGRVSEASLCQKYRQNSS